MIALLAVGKKVFIRVHRDAASVGNVYTGSLYVPFLKFIYS